MYRARQLSQQAIADGDPTGWFERLYAEGEAGRPVVPGPGRRPTRFSPPGPAAGPAPGSGRS
jgi:hypothetical protein